VTQLGHFHRVQKQYADTERLYLRAILGYDRLAAGSFDAGDRRFLIETLADIYQQQGRLAEAEPLLRRFLQERESVLGEEIPTLLVVNKLALLLAAQGRFAEAEPLAQRAERWFNQRGGPSNPDLRALVTGLASQCAAQGRNEAEPLCRNA
jgi:tetratricopeptide (TPR) repeat protein